MDFKQISKQLQDWLGDFYSPVVTVVKIVAIVVLTFFIVRIGSFIIKKLFEKQKTFKYGSNTKRIDTMSTLLVSIFRYVVYIMAGITILSDLFNLKSILAAAGIGGVAVGLGAQSLIKDVISGFFILLEDQFAVGDLITIDNMNGTVEEMELRVTKIRNFNGDLYIIPNGEIKKVTNHTRGNKAVVVDVPIAYSADIEKAMGIADNVCKVVAGEFSTIVEPPKVLGITDLGKDSVNMRITAKTLPNEHWEVERRIRRLIKEEFEKEKIAFYDKNEILVREDLTKGGNQSAG